MAYFHRTYFDETYFDAGDGWLVLPPNDGIWTVLLPDTGGPDEE